MLLHAILSTLSTASTVSLAVLLASAAPEPASGSRFRGALYLSAFTGGEKPVAELRQAALPAHDQERLERYLGRHRAFRSALVSARGVSPGLLHRRQVVERAIVALLDRPDADGLAADFAEKAIGIEEAMPRSGGPWGEAIFAEEVLRTNPDTPLTPYLFLFLCDRYRAAYELAGAEADPLRQKQAARKYRTFVTRARAAQDRLMVWLAEDLDARKFLAYDTGVHPRDFNPDG